ncbi:DUF3556 domain-containing protein [Nocardioides sp. WS12]|uniref:DUF3556 domain-containing protein n=1 Tax=Nocardioides sp. WS12 TaxID=2486272 RepID=UPI0015FA02AE|nr:DUF3556 domain-containing protein [Nocardioides sp. WS12]
MPLIRAVLPDIDPVVHAALPLRERIRIAATFWADNGFGTPRYVHMIYILKVTVWYALGGLLIISATSDLGGLGNLDQWWTEPVVYQKAIAWTLLMEVVGFGGAWGPLCGHFKPFTGGARYWLRPGTIRVAPWRWIPGTAGDSRTFVDITLYAALLVSLATAVVWQGDRVPAALAALAAVLLVVNGLRDSIVFLAARGEQYLPALVFTAMLDGADFIIAAKVLIVTVWIGAGFSKFGLHFANVIPPMVSNAPFVPGKLVRRLHYKNAPDDLRPSKLSWGLAHFGGTCVEMLTPLILLFSTNETVTLLAVGVMVSFHVFITMTFPLAVPLEWNVLFAFLAAFLFWGHHASDGYAVTDFSEPWLLVLIAACLLVSPVVGNLRPDKVSFLASLRQYAGNWASAVWAFSPGAEEKMLKLDLPAPPMTDQLMALLKYDRPTAEQCMSLIAGWRSLHSQGRGLFSVFLARYDDIDQRTVREGEFMSNWVRGWNFGDGHLHDDRMIAAIQARVGFEPGELIVVFVESQPVHKRVQEYRIIDAALGVIERGTWRVADAVAEQPWLPNGPIPLEVTWRAEAATGVTT